MNKIATIVINVFLLSFFLGYSAVISADVWDKWDSHKEEYNENEGIEEYVWKEGKNNLPEYPQDSNLAAITGPAAYRNYQYLLDIKTLTVGSDGVVRYSIVIRSSSGADNVMFDGIRCTTRQMINYAYGNTDMKGNKKFIEKTNAVWKPLRSIGVLGYSLPLATDYFCNFSGIPLTQHEIIQNIKYGQGSVDSLMYN